MRSGSACNPNSAFLRRSWRMTTAGPVEWMVFWIVVALASAVDICVACYGRRTPTRLNAALWSCVWIGLGLLFDALFALRLGAEAGTTYLTAYLVEVSLSVDKLFLVVLIIAQT